MNPELTSIVSSASFVLNAVLICIGLLVCVSTILIIDNLLYKYWKPIKLISYVQHLTVPEKIEKKESKPNDVVT